MLNDYFLIFSFGFDSNPDLDYGLLTLNSLSKGTVEVWKATSAGGTTQYRESFQVKGGLIPPQYRCKNLPNYTVMLKPLAMPYIKGVEGNFYKISPHLVNTDKGTLRGDFGIHLDANAPGSLGCIVMSKDRFTSFEQRMRELVAKGLIDIPLFVQYS